MTNSNYEQAVDALLETRFLQKHIIVNEHIEALLSLQKVSSERDISNIRKLYDVTEIHVRSLKTLGIDFKQYCKTVRFFYSCVDFKTRTIINTDSAINFKY